MTQRASDLLSELADRLSAHVTESGIVAAEAVRAIEPDVLKSHKDGSDDELVKLGRLRAFVEPLGIGDLARHASPSICRRTCCSRPNRYGVQLSWAFPMSVTGRVLP